MAAPADAFLLWGGHLTCAELGHRLGFNHCEHVWGGALSALVAFAGFNSIVPLCTKAATVQHPMSKLSLWHIRGRFFLAFPLLLPAAAF